MLIPEIVEFTQEELELLQAVAANIPALDDLFYQELEGYGDE